jgi:cellobiose phosphorylase
VLEHLLVQHVTAFLNVGEHNIMRLEGGDWNDGLDMADERGESVAFTALYAGNLRQLAALVRALAARGTDEIVLAAEIGRLLTDIDYDSIPDKHTLLHDYFERVAHTLSGELVSISAETVAANLVAKADWLIGHLRQQEWVEDAAGNGWYNGYYDDDGQRVEGDHPLGTRMTLTGQVFALMGGVATDEQVQQIFDSAEMHLYDPAVGGYKLNTDFGAVLTNMGRLFGFAYGHKENGAMFTHMATMYANALYQRGFAQEGQRVLQELYEHCQNFAVSRMYPGLPEYVSDTGRGMYPYLTGSASWYILTVLQDMFGVRGAGGDLALQPNLAAEQFDDDNSASVVTLFAGRRLHIAFVNSARLDIGRYRIDSVSIDGRNVPVRREGTGVVVKRAEIASLSAENDHQLVVSLVAED